MAYHSLSPFFARVLPPGLTRLASGFLPGLLAGLFSAGAVCAQEGPGRIANPQDYNLSPMSPAPAERLAAPQGGVPGQLFISRSGTTPVPQEVELDINIVMAKRRIYNPQKDGTGGYDRVWLRTYEDARAPSRPGEDAPLVGPTISVHPGQTVRMTLNNKLEADSTCGIGPSGSVNIPHCFNGTNMHTHGLWINPSGNGDNVLINIQPGVSFQYEYNIPPDHPAGTFWYHPHLHGSTALQVSSGMSGALIIRGDRKPAPDRNGDIDTLLIGENGRSIAERVLVLQQIQYACRNDRGGIETGPNGYICKSGQTGEISGYDQFGPGTWRDSGRYTSINGVVLGRMADAKAGVPERWRWIHAGVRDSINVEIRHKTGTEDYRTLAADENSNWIEQNCGARVPYHVIAQDGLTMAAAQGREQAVLQPGYRVDALVVLPEEGDYCVIDADMPAAGTVNNIVPSRQLLGVVSATGNAQAGADSGQYITDWLVAAAERTMPEDVRASVIDDLKDGLKLTRFEPHQTIAADEVTGTQTLVFNIDVSQPGAAFFEVDGKPYDPNRIDRTVPVGGVDEWTLTSDFVSHPFHIHVNPFQIVSIIAPDGRTDVSESGAVDDFDRRATAPDPQYPGLKGVWKDTLWVKSLLPGQRPGKYIVTIRTRYQRYIGDFVLHCHILDHEDQGMMQNVRIALPDGRGGTVHGHAH